MIVLVNFWQISNILRIFGAKIIMVKSAGCRVEAEIHTLFLSRFVYLWCQNESSGALRTRLLPTESSRSCGTDDIAAIFHCVLATIPSHSQIQKQSSNSHPYIREMQARESIPIYGCGKSHPELKSLVK